MSRQIAEVTRIQTRFKTGEALKKWGP